jgi:hypothetical protein
MSSRSLPIEVTLRECHLDNQHTNRTKLECHLRLFPPLVMERLSNVKYSDLILIHSYTWPSPHPFKCCDIRLKPVRPYQRTLLYYVMLSLDYRCDVQIAEEYSRLSRIKIEGS